MVASKSKLVNVAFAALAALPVAAAGVFTFTDSAQAAVLTGEFSAVGNGTASLTSTSLTFNNPNTFNVLFGSGTFAPFTLGKISNITAFGNPATLVQPLFDLGTNAAETADGKNIFNLTAASFSTRDTTTPGLVAIDVVTSGTFIGDTGEVSTGEGIFTLQTGGTKAAIDNILANGGTISNLTYSSFYFGTPRAAVPEPATMLGLGLVGAGIVFSRRRKSVA